MLCLEEIVGGCENQAVNSKIFCIYQEITAFYTAIMLAYHFCAVI